MIPVRRSQNWLPGIFNDFFGNEWMEKANANAPAINIMETNHEYKVEVAAPGLTKDDFSVKLNDDNELSISMEKKHEQKNDENHGRYLRREFSYSQFQQNMILPDNVDKSKIDAKVEHGVLTVNIPKKEVAPEKNNAKQIEIK